MNILEALKTDKKFRRSGWLQWSEPHWKNAANYSSNKPNAPLTFNDIRADDWEVLLVERCGCKCCHCIRKVDVSTDNFETAMKHIERERESK